MFSSALTDSWSFFKNHLISLSLIILPIVVPLEIITSIYQYTLTSEENSIAVGLLPISLSILLYPIYKVAVVFYIASVIEGTRYTIKELYAIGLRYWLPYLIITFFIGIIVIGGLMFFIIPGIIFIIRYSFTEFELILNQQKPLDAMRNSWESTSEYMSTLFFGYAIITACLYVPVIIMLLTVEESSTLKYFINTAFNVIYAVVNTLYTIYTYRIYGFSKET